MAGETTPTRTETVTANIAEVVAKYGDDAFLHLMAKCAQDISLSLAALVDAENSNSSSSGSGSSS